MPTVNGNYVAPTWVNDAPPAIDAAELQAMSDGIERMQIPAAKGSGISSLILNSLSSNTASGVYSVAEGVGCAALGPSTHAEGNYTISSGQSSHAEGTSCYAGSLIFVITGISGNTLTFDSTIPGFDSGFANIKVGDNLRFISAGSYPNVDNFTVTAKGTNSVTVSQTPPYPIPSPPYIADIDSETYYSHAEGLSCAAERTSHAEGSRTAAITTSHAEGASTLSAGTGSHAEGYQTKATGSQGSHAEGGFTAASGPYAHAEGEESVAQGEAAHAEGVTTTASGNYSHAEGGNTVASGYYAHAEGIGSIAQGDYSHAAGETIAEANFQTTVGKVNVANSTSSSAWFVVGCGSTGAPANCFRVASSAVYGGTYNSSGADYAEYFEWLDGNPENEDRAGRFVTLDGDKLKLAGPEDDFILGIVSGMPSIVGDSFDDQWQGMYLCDVFGRPLWEDVEVPAVEQTRKDPDNPDRTVTETVIKAHIEHVRKRNPDYDHQRKYKARSERREWDAVGIMGKLVAVDDGSCSVNGWAKVGADGVASASAERTKYRVMERLDETHIRVLIL